MPWANSFPPNWAGGLLRSATSPAESPVADKPGFRAHCSLPESFVRKLIRSQLVPFDGPSVEGRRGRWIKLLAAVPDNSAACRAIVHLRGREKALEPLGWTGRRAEWIVLVCLHCGAFTRAQWARFMDAHPEQLRGGVHADREGLAAGETALPFGGPGEFAASIPGAPTGRSAPRTSATAATPGPPCPYEGKPKPGSPGRVSTSKGPMRRVEPERPRLRRTGLSDAAKAGEPAYPVPFPHASR